MAHPRVDTSSTPEPHHHRGRLPDMTRQRDGTWTVNGETLPPFPSPPPAPMEPTDLDMQRQLEELNRAAGRPLAYA